MGLDFLLSGDGSGDSYDESGYHRKNLLFLTAASPFRISKAVFLREVGHAADSAYALRFINEELARNEIITVSDVLFRSYMSFDPRIIENYASSSFVRKNPLDIINFLYSANPNNGISPDDDLAKRLFDKAAASLIGYSWLADSCMFAAGFSVPLKLNENEVIDLGKSSYDKASRLYEQLLGTPIVNVLVPLAGKKVVNVNDATSKDSYQEFNLMTLKGHYDTFMKRFVDYVIVAGIAKGNIISSIGKEY